MSCEKEKCICCKAIQAFEDVKAGHELFQPLSIAIDGGKTVTMENPVVDMSLATIYLAGRYGDAGAELFLCELHKEVFAMVKGINR